ncbi:MAG TPA: U32 family peptidase, partial [Candidatus Marinimicrobia bacterium]|nr:U32 family peptidase [Candidatus Neomarinimicrobiota bacterium]
MTDIVMTPPELLVPAGDIEKMRYAFAFGADAVYAGVPKYSLRTREIGFREADLAAAIAEAHSFGKKFYATMNIYAHNSKVDGFLKALELLLDAKPDAIIMSDPGLIYESLRRFPNLIIHLSTQANTTNRLSVKMWRDLGVKRIILPRELQLSEIAEMHQAVPDIELEAFVHGAICIAYSGRCLISNYLNHRDANQGTCTNSCRWEYKLMQERASILDVEKTQEPRKSHNDLPSNLAVKESHRSEYFPIFEDEAGTYLFNAKDLCAIELIPELIKSGIISLKVEGRTKSAWYAAMTARAYRSAIDDAVSDKSFKKENLRDLLSLSNRCYTSGFYTRNPRQYGENFTDGYSRSEGERVAGKIHSYDSASGLARFTILNRIKKGEK